MLKNIDWQSGQGCSNIVSLIKSVVKDSLNLLVHIKNSAKAPHIFRHNRIVFFFFFVIHLRI